jgi:hypothetical protein
MGADQSSSDGSGGERQRLGPQDRVMRCKNQGGGKAIQAGDEILGNVRRAIVAAGRERKHAKHQDAHSGTEISAVKRYGQHDFQAGKIEGDLMTTALGSRAQPARDPFGVGEE